MIIQPSKQKGKNLLHPTLIYVILEKVHQELADWVEPSPAKISTGCFHREDLMNILLVGDDVESQAESLHTLQEALGDEIAARSVASFSDARQELESGQYHIVLDLGLPKETRWRLFRLAQQLDPRTQVIMVFEGHDEDQAIDALRRGASEVLLRRGAYLARLLLIVERAYERYLLLTQRRPAVRPAFDLQTLNEFTQAIAQAMDLSKAMEGARTALREIDTLLEKSQEELVRRRTMLREAGSEVQRRERGLEALSELADAVSSSPNLDFILTNALDQAVAMTAAEAGAVLVIEDESKPLRPAAKKELSDPFIAALSGWRSDVSAFMTILLSGQVLLVPDTTPGDAHSELLTLLSQEGLTSMISVPLQVGGKLLGALVVATRHTEKLTATDARWLGVIGQQAGIAIENARLRTEIWEAAEAWFHQSTAPLPEPPEESQDELKRLAQAVDEAKQELRHRENALSALINVVSMVSDQFGVQDVLREILPYILDESEAGGIWTRDAFTDTLTLAAQEGLPESLARSWSREEWERDDLLASLMSGEVIYLDDPTSPPNSDLLGHLKAAGARVVIGIPLQVKRHSVGAIVIMAPQHGHLQAHDAELLTAVGQQLSQAMERQELYDEIRRLALELAAIRTGREEMAPIERTRAEEHTVVERTKDWEEKGPDRKDLSALLELALSFFPLLDPDELLETATQEIAGVTGMDACWVMVPRDSREDEGGRLIMRAHHGLSWRLAEHMSQVPTEDRLYSQIVASDQPLFVADLNETDEELPLAWESESWRAFAGLPLSVEGHSLGFLGIAQTQVHQFSPSEQIWLSAIAQQLAIALHNAQHVTQVQQVAAERKEANRVLREINNVLMESLIQLEKRLEPSRTPSTSP